MKKAELHHEQRPHLSQCPKNLIIPAALSRMQGLFSTSILQRKKLRPEKVSGHLQLSALLSDLRSQGQEVRRALP